MKIIVKYLSSLSFALKAIDNGTQEELRGAHLRQLLHIKGPVIDNEAVALHSAVRRQVPFTGEAAAQRYLREKVPRGLICSSQMHAQFGDDL